MVTLADEALWREAAACVAAARLHKREAQRHRREAQAALERFNMLRKELADRGIRLVVPPP